MCCRKLVWYIHSPVAFLKFLQRTSLICQEILFSWIARWFYWITIITGRWSLILRRPETTSSHLCFRTEPFFNSEETDDSCGSAGSLVFPGVLHGEKKRKVWLSYKWSHSSRARLACRIRKYEYCSELHLVLCWNAENNFHMKNILGAWWLHFEEQFLLVTCWVIFALHNSRFWSFK